MKCDASVAMLAALRYLPSPPVRRGRPGTPPRGGKPPNESTARQRLFEQAVWDMADQRGNAFMPASFEVDGFGLVRLDYGCIDMAAAWLNHEKSAEGWPVRLQIKPDAWAAGRPSAAPPIE